MTKRKQTNSLRAKRTDKMTKTLIATLNTKSAGLVREKFDIDKLPPSIKKSPLKLKHWLDLHIPALIGPRIDSFDPPGGQRDTILTIRGENFAANWSDNQATIGGNDVPVLAASTTELKALVTKDVDTGLLKVKIATRTSVGPYKFTVEGYPGGNDDGPPVFALGSVSV